MRISLPAIGKWLAIAALPLAMATNAQAQATGTWVSGVGDDVNPCSRTAPCKTFAGAISKTAAGGEIRVLDPGGYGAVTITKSITITGDGTLASVLASGTHGIIVNAAPTDVVILRNLSLVGVGASLNGIVYSGGAELHVQNSNIYGFSGQGILFMPGGNGKMFVSGSSLRNNAGGGIYVIPGASGQARVSLDGVSLEGNGRGLQAEDGASIVVRNSSVVGNDFNGITAVGASRAVDISLENTAVSHNGAVGISAGANSTVRLTGVLATRNDTGLQAINGGAIVSFGNNRVNGNITANGAPTSTPGQI